MGDSELYQLLDKCQDIARWGGWLLLLDYGYIGQELEIIASFVDPARLEVDADWATPPRSLLFTIVYQARGATMVEAVTGLVRAAVEGSGR
ncbi:MAG: hypothetical protein BWY76_00618 [bacterium ADurb.Bin429]|nr:MAG: hypothetical protein BWY76_00618 [bacterium ADurb.Bin429]